MAIAFGDKTSGGFDYGVTPKEIVAPAVSGSNTYMLFGLIINAGGEPEPTTATYDGVSLGTPIASVRVDYVRVMLWGLVNPGSAKVFAVTGLTSNVTVLFAWYYTGVNQSAPYRTVSTASMTNPGSSPTTVNVTNSQVGDLIAGLFGCDDTTLGIIGEGQTSRGVQSGGAANDAYGGICDEPGASGTVVHSWAINTTIYGWVVHALPLIPAGGGAIDLVPAEGAQEQAADVPALTQVHNLVIAEGVQTQGSDAPALTQVHVLATQEGAQEEVSDSPALTQVHVLAAAEGVQVEVSDSPALTQGHILAADEGAQIQVSDAPTLIQIHALTPAEGIQEQTSDVPVLTQVHILVPAEGVQEQISDQTTITVGGVDLVAAEGVQAQISDTPAITQVHVLVPADGVQAQASDSPILTQVHTLAPAKGFQAQVSDAAILDLSILLATQKGYQAQYSDSPTLTVISAKVGTDSSLWASKKGLHKPLGKKWYKPGVRGQQWYRPSEKLFK